jgi:hypothetical protein
LRERRNCKQNMTRRVLSRVVTGGITWAKAGRQFLMIMNQGLVFPFRSPSLLIIYIPKATRLTPYYPTRSHGAISSSIPKSSHVSTQNIALMSLVALATEAAGKLDVLL